jgi:protein O-GlcNAc transferase
VDGSRLVFAPRCAPAEHLGRHRAADLFLDTWPYNAHTTASDALWAGLPLLTRRGEAFAGRVAASLLHASGLPELVTQSAEDYVHTALQLAREPARLAALRRRLATHGARSPLFDTPRFARDLESLYLQMWNRRRNGLPPAALHVPRQER